MAARMTDAELKRTLKILRKHKGDRIATARELGLEPSAVTTRVTNIRKRLPSEAIPASTKTRPTSDPSVIRATMEAIETHGSWSKAAAALGISRSTVQHHVEAARIRTDWRPRGSVSARRAVKRPLPKRGKIARYILTCAQSDTKLHEPTWKALNALAERYSAEIMVSTFTYRHRQEGSAKRGTATGAGDADQYDPRIEPFVVDEMVELAPALVFNGHMNILPTATDPLSGMDNYNGRASSIFPHAKVAMKSVATMSGQPAKLQYTTGAATQLNYLQKKAGQKAEFDHVFGGLIVEVNSAGEWWTRQIQTDRKGRIYDLDWCATESVEGSHYVVCPSIGSTALIFGDIHVAQLDEKTQTQRWGEKGMVATLRPDYQVMHDVLDFESRSHHNRRDPHKMFELHTRGRESVQQEVEMVGGFLNMAAHRGGRVVVVNSNHDRHMERWLKEADWRTDPVNAEFYMACQQAFLGSLRAGVHFDALKWAVGKFNAAKGVRFLEAGTSFVVCRDASGGVELGLHGDLGPSGSRGSIRNLARIGRKVVIGHSHSAGIFNGAYQTGLTPSVDAPGFSYSRGAPSAWSHTDCVVYANGKRALITWWRGKWRA